MLTRSGVAKRLGKSIATVRRMENVELHPVRDARGVLRFSEEQVERLAGEQSRGGVRRHRIDLSSPFRADGFERSFDHEASELEQLRQRVAELEEERRADVAARQSAEASAAAIRAREADIQRRRSEEDAKRSAEAEELRRLRSEAADLLHGLTRRELAKLDPADLNALVNLLDDEP